MLTAAGRRLTLSDQKLAARQAGKRQQWQEEAWSYFDEVPEIKYTDWWLGNQISKARLFVGVQPDPEADPVPVLRLRRRDPENPDSELVEEVHPGVPEDLARAAAAELARLRSPLGGQAEILRETNINLEVAGELFIVGRGERGTPGDDDYQAEQWDVKSISEVDVPTGQGPIKVKASPDDRQPAALDPDLDTAIRIWQRHPRWSELADSAMRGVLGDCEALLILSRQVKAEAKSRLPAGLLLIPNDVSWSIIDPTHGEDQEEAEGDPFMEALNVALTEPIEDESAVHSVAPMVVRASSEALKEIRHISLARTADATLEDRIKARVERISRGLNVPIEVVYGHQATTFANAEQVDQDTYEDHLQPRLVLIADALTVGFLRPQLLDQGYAPEDVDRLQVWFDASHLVAQPEPGEAADEAFDRNVISAEAYRRYKGFGEDDAPDAEELLQRAGLRRGILTAELTLALLELLGVPIDVEPIESGDGGGGAGDAPSPEARALAAALYRALPRNGHQPAALPAAARVPADNPGRALMELDQHLRDRLLTLSEAAMERALERAGARVHSRASSNTALRVALGGHRGWGALRHAGREAVVAQAGVNEQELLRDAFDGLGDQFARLVEQAQAQALATVEAVTGPLGDAERRQVEAQQAEDREGAWAWLLAALTALALARLFEPEPEPDAVGEAVDGRVPPGMLREAMGRAGGASGFSRLAGEGTALVDAAGRPTGGVGTGELVQQLLQARGATLDAWRWTYGPALRLRPFEPHLRLHGTVVTRFDDDRLVNAGSWPVVSHYMPGDHKGCLCDYEPVVIGPGDGNGRR